MDWAHLRSVAASSIASPPIFTTIVTANPPALPTRTSDSCFALTPCIARAVGNAGDSTNYRTPFPDAAGGAGSQAYRQVSGHSVAAPRSHPTATRRRRPGPHRANHSDGRRQRPQRHAAQRRDRQAEADRKAVEAPADGAEPVGLGMGDPLGE